MGFNYYPALRAPLLKEGEWGLFVIVYYLLFTVAYSLLTVHCSLFTAHCSLFTVHCSLLIIIEFDEAEEHHREGPEGGASVADEGQWDADDGQQSDGHADVDEEVEDEDTRDAVSVVADKRISLFFR